MAADKMALVFMYVFDQPDEKETGGLFVSFLNLQGVLCTQMTTVSTCYLQPLYVLHIYTFTTLDLHFSYWHLH
jgi:hypothetical protein